MTENLEKNQYEADKRNKENQIEMKELKYKLGNEIDELKKNKEDLIRKLSEAREKIA